MKNRSLMRISLRHPRESGDLFGDTASTSLYVLANEDWDYVFRGRSEYLLVCSCSAPASHRPAKHNPNPRCSLQCQKELMCLLIRAMLLLRIAPQNITSYLIAHSGDKRSENIYKCKTIPLTTQSQTSMLAPKRKVVKQLCRALLLCTQFFVLQPTTAATITIPGIDDTALNNNLVSLAQSSAPIPAQEAQVTNVVDSLLTNLAPQIKALPGYDNPFVVNCTIFFNSQINKVKCDLDFDPPEELLEHADINREILRANLHELPNTNILVTRTYVDWSAGTYLFGKGKFYLQRPRIKGETEALSKTFSATEETTETLAVTSSTTRDTTESCSVVNTPSATPDIASPMVLETPSVVDTPSMSLELSQTLTPVPIPTANWSAASGIYTDATNQPNRYTINNDVVTDTFSNLQWEGAASNTTMSWSNATDYCANRTTGGHKGWRLPAVQELQSLVDYTINWKGDIPGINGTAFPDTPLNYFWSAVPVAGFFGEAWYVSYGKDACYSGLVCTQANGWCTCVSSNVGYIRCVYGSTIPPVTNNRYDNTSITNVVKDVVTGLMWERKASGSYMAWQDAITYCKSQNTGGFSGWRLPAVKELSTLINYNITPGKLIMNKDIFLGEIATNYWSATPVSDYPVHALYVYFGSSFVGYGVLSLSNGVRCVCSGSDCLLIPIANWKAETGVYEDATNQTGRYKVEDGIVTDMFSNLQWEQANSTIPMSWSDADNYCANRTTGGHNGWRLPAVQELQSLVDYTIPYKGDIPGINVTAFPKTPLNYFWSATPMAEGTPQESWCHEHVI